METWVEKEEPPPLYIPLRKQQPQLSGHFVSLETESNDVEDDSHEDSEMTWLEAGKGDPRLGIVTGVRKELVWPSKQNRVTQLGKSSFNSLRPGQM